MTVKELIAALKQLPDEHYEVQLNIADHEYTEPLRRVVFAANAVYLQDF
jgi:hypothetical protein